MDQERIDYLLKRKRELFAPIEMQIYTTDDKDELLLLASNMCESAIRIYMNEFGEKSAKGLIDNLFEIVSISSSTG